MNPSKITIFTDGSSRGNPGYGGWGAIVIGNELVTELGGAEKNTTNNRMELIAVIEGLRKADEFLTDNTFANNSKKSLSTDKTLHGEEIPQVVVYTDSSYIINGITKWIHGWKRNGWVTKTKDDVLNKDLWLELDGVLGMIGSRNVSWKYVGGHVGIAGNERCDIIATSFADGEKVKLYSGSVLDYPIKNILDISSDVVKSETKKTSSSRSKKPAYSYVSSIKGNIKIHHTWADCEKRVKGVKGARYKKAISAKEEAEIKAEFGGLI